MRNDITIDGVPCETIDQFSLDRYSITIAQAQPADSGFYYARVSAEPFGHHTSEYTSLPTHDQIIGDYVDWESEIAIDLMESGQKLPAMETHRATINIYQIDMDRDEKRVCFMSLAHLETLTGAKEPDSADYEIAYTGYISKTESLEDIYRRLNIDHPTDYRTRSLSVSDVVEVHNSDTIRDGCYFCDSFGFAPVQFSPEKVTVSQHYNLQCRQSRPLTIREQMAQAMGRSTTAPDKGREPAQKEQDSLSLDK